MSWKNKAAMVHHYEIGGTEINGYLEQVRIRLPSLVKAKLRLRAGDRPLAAWCRDRLVEMVQEDVG